MYFENIDGLIYYTRDGETLSDVVAAGATLANVRTLYRQNSRVVARAFGASAAIVAGINLAKRGTIAYVMAQSQTLAAQVSMRGALGGFF